MYVHEQIYSGAKLLTYPRRQLGTHRLTVPHSTRRENAGKLGNMADVYTPPPDFSYLLVTPFSMPSDIGDRWAVSFTGNSSTLVAAALSIVVTVSFLCLWNFISFIAVLAVPKSTRHRYVAAVVIWNSNDPWFAFKELLKYTYRQAQSKRAGWWNHI